ncbi:hypothetical protein ACOTB3_20430 [Achromobacter xylosoxidans]|uniref:hypothetical protein n=1 Tax=Alcaligenes xylosoxydans xylosoxydans TaxID=85698 RepID=UPI0012A92EC1|nr:hypothetical protein [Achromobacter xylosoxidans]MBK1982940.1 hypothetical protein [Achromobacter xylosoxidans]MCZ8382999.1 hypothetical protein [Achromobacter xylosoxidans]CUR66585.1 hypothetical protein BN2877_19940 [Achromobacter xylosoxidans]
MRVLFILILLANLGVYAQGQGWLGMRPEDEGRDTRRFTQELNPGAVTLVPRASP